MAEALLGLIAGDHFEAESAGSHPAWPQSDDGRVHALRSASMSDTIDRRVSKNLSDSPSTTSSRCAIEPGSPVRSFPARPLFDIGLLMIPPQPQWRSGSRSSGRYGMKLQIGYASFCLKRCESPLPPCSAIVAVFSLSLTPFLIFYF